MIHSVIDPYTERQTMGFGGVLQEYVQITVLVPVASLTGADCTHAAMLPDGRYLTVDVREAAEVDRQLAGYDPTSGTSPLVAVARPIARGHLDALRAADSLTSRSSSSDG